MTLYVNEDHNYYHMLFNRAIRSLLIEKTKIEIDTAAFYVNFEFNRCTFFQ